MILLRCTENCCCYRLGSLPVTLLFLRFFFLPLSYCPDISFKEHNSKQEWRNDRKKTGISALLLGFDKLLKYAMRTQHLQAARYSLQLLVGRESNTDCMMQTSYRVVQTAFLLQACLWAVHPKTLLVSTPWSGFSSSEVENILKIWSPALKSTADHQTKTNQWKHKITSIVIQGNTIYFKEGCLLKKAFFWKPSHPENCFLRKK